MPAKNVPTHLDPGDRMAGKHDPPRPCVIITRYRARGGPRNVAVEYLDDDGGRAVIPCPRRLRLAEPAARRNGELADAT